MFSLEITPAARAAIIEQFALMELREPALFIYRQPPAADLVRSAAGHTHWSIPGYIVDFIELPAEAVGSPRFLVVDGIRVIVGPMDAQPFHTTARASFQDGKLCIEDVVGSDQESDLHSHGTPLGLISHGEVLSSSGAHRLRLLFIASGPGFDFHSIRFEADHDGEWQPEVSLTQKQFQGEHKFRRWVSKLHTVQDDSGIALVQVGEDSSPIGALSSWVSYSWRAWDLRKNVEVRRLKDCKRPAEPLE